VDTDDDTNILTSASTTKDPATTTTSAPVTPAKRQWREDKGAPVKRKTSRAEVAPDDRSQVLRIPPRCGCSVVIDSLLYQHDISTQREETIDC
ncbi:hypothetical protein M8C21_004197, partial [Ambrosia artemisiifolia]